MLPAPILVYQCPTCKNLIKNFSLMSGNTKGAKMYSDGKMIAPMYPEFPDLTKCKKCNTIFWLSDLEVIGSYSDDSNFLYHVSNRFRHYHNDLEDLEDCEKVDDELNMNENAEYEETDDTEESKWRKADKAKFLNITDYFKAISLGLASDFQKELFIRQRIWWRFNDRVRNGKEIFIDENDNIRWRENCLELIELLEKNYPDVVILIADLYRNLGDFEKCMRLIDSIKPNRIDDEVILIQEKFRSESKKKNTLVFRLY